MAADVAAIVLAAGRATRFAGPSGDSKVFATLGGRSLLEHVVDAAAESRVWPVVVVTGQGAERCAALLRRFDGIVLAHNAGFAAGMAGSLRTGLAALPHATAAAVILLADMPRVRTTTIDALVDAFDRLRPDAVVPTYDGRRGNPVLVGRSIFPVLMQLTGDEGARRVIGGGAHRVLPLPVEDPGILIDVDTPDALAALGGN